MKGCKNAIIRSSSDVRNKTLEIEEIYIHFQMYKQSVVYKLRITKNPTHELFDYC
jgi:hypothetical protein